MRHGCDVLLIKAGCCTRFTSFCTIQQDLDQGFVSVAGMVMAGLLLFHLFHLKGEKIDA
jgi:hypothetical protein